MEQDKRGATHLWLTPKVSLSLVGVTGGYRAHIKNATSYAKGRICVLLSDFQKGIRAGRGSVAPLIHILTILFVNEKNLRTNLRNWTRLVNRITVCLGEDMGCVQTFAACMPLVKRLRNCIAAIVADQPLPETTAGVAHILVSIMQLCTAARSRSRDPSFLRTTAHEDTPDDIIATAFGVSEEHVRVARAQATISPLKLLLVQAADPAATARQRLTAIFCLQIRITNPAYHRTAKGIPTKVLNTDGIAACEQIFDHVKHAMKFHGSKNENWQERYNTEILPYKLAWQWMKSHAEQEFFIWRAVANLFADRAKPRTPPVAFTPITEEQAVASAKVAQQTTYTPHPDALDKHVNGGKNTAIGERHFLDVASKVKHPEICSNFVKCAQKVYSVHKQRLIATMPANKTELRAKKRQIALNKKEHLAEGDIAGRGHSLARKDSIRPPLQPKENTNMGSSGGVLGAKTPLQTQQRKRSAQKDTKEKVSVKKVKRQTQATTISVGPNGCMPLAFRDHGYRNLVQIQKPCGAKPCTWLAQQEDGEWVFIKESRKSGTFTVNAALDAFFGTALQVPSLNFTIVQQPGWLSELFVCKDVTNGGRECVPHRNTPDFLVLKNNPSASNHLTEIGMSTGLRAEIWKALARRALFRISDTTLKNIVLGTGLDDLLVVYGSADAMQQSSNFPSCRPGTGLYDAGGFSGRAFGAPARAALKMSGLLAKLVLEALKEAWEMWHKVGASYPALSAPTPEVYAFLRSLLEPFLTRNY
jgi:hypothetical protein